MKFIEKISVILAIIDKYLPAENDESIADRANVRPQTVASWRETGKANSNKAFQLVISFYEDPLFDYFIHDAEVMSFLEGYLKYSNRHFIEPELRYVLRDIVKPEYRKMTFENALDILELKYKGKWGLPTTGNEDAREYGE
ncbi:MAG: hypothetical protein LBJ41_11220 [Treponema sp.]|jgi:hypothetical protein|nr:hypothetical protein [Treponema sp.]